MNQENELRLELRVKNNRLYNLIFKNYDNVKAFCRIENLSFPTIYNLVNLKKSIRMKNGDYIPTVKKIADILHTYPEIIFPDDIYKIETTKMIAVVPLSSLLIGHNKDGIYIEDHTDKLFQDNVKETIEVVLDTIPERERRIIKQRYGIDCDPMTLEEIGKIEGVSRDRIRQIQCRALRRLRHPKRAKKMEHFMEVV